jgi:dolichol-phosphate mannosyltransferase
MIAKQHVDTEATARELELSIVIPTFNESGNVVAPIERLARALEGIVWEVVFVDDDSPDSTAALLRQEARRDPRVRCLQRIGRRGLSSACVEGMLASSAPCVAVMDADLQHDETLLPRMLESLRRGDLDIVVGSRYIEGGNVGDWPAHRLSFSRIATWLARRVLRAELSDPMSGFFMLRREALEGCVRNLSAIGFKILLDIFASSPRPLRFAELPFVFRMRRPGKASSISASPGTTSCC